MSGAVQRRAKAARVSPTAARGRPAGRAFESFDAQVGTRVHTLLGYYATRGLRPSIDALIDDVHALLKAHPIESEFTIPPSRVITAAAAGLRHLPPVEVPCRGSEVRVCGARADSVWELDETAIGFDTFGGLLVMEYTATSDARRLLSEQRVRQVSAELAAGIRSGESFAGVSLINLSYPPSSLFFLPSLGPEFPVDLIETRFWFGPRPIRYQKLTEPVR